MAKYKKFRDELDPNAPIWSIRINQCLLDNNITQAELAQMSDLSPGTISSWISGNRYGVFAEPRANGLKRVANVLNVSIDYLLGNIDVKSTNLDIRDICIKTGLKEETITYLFGASSKNLTGIVDAIVENETTNNAFLDIINDIIVVSEYLISIGYPKLSVDTIINYLGGAREFPELKEAEHDYINKYMSLELNIFKLQNHFSELVKRISKFNDIQIMKKRKF